MTLWGNPNACCPTTTTCPPTTTDIITKLCEINNTGVNIWTAIQVLQGQLFNDVCPVFVRDTQLKACLDALALPTGVSGTWDSQDVDDTGTTYIAGSWQTIRVTNPSTNANNATVDIGGNVRTLVPTTLVDPTLGIVEISFPYFALAPAATVTAGAAETVVVEILNF